jgi:hypothetical protein
MKPDPEKRREAAPRARGNADEEMPMDPRLQSHATPAGPDDRVLEELAHWEDLPAERLAVLEADPACGPRLELLRRVENILEAAIGAEESCPDPEELYDFGRGPGYEPLAFERRRSIELHLDRCSACAGHVRSLAASPPLPLDVSPPADLRVRRGTTQAPPRVAPFGVASQDEDAAGPFAAPAARPTPRGRETGAPFSRAEDPFAEPTGSRWSTANEPSPRRSELGPHWRGDRARPRARAVHLRTLVALAAAASLLLFLWPESKRLAGGPLAGTLPTAPLLRGDAGGPLYFPRGKVLMPPLGQGPGASRIDYADQPLFELAGVEGATLYRVTLRRHDGGAFAEGREIQHIESTHGTELQAEEALAPGFYTWEAWAIVDGLDQHLGERDFEVVQDEELCKEIESLDDKAAVRRLHEAGFLTDARALAKRLPHSAERDAYLDTLPGR